MYFIFLLITQYLYISVNEQVSRSKESVAQLSSLQNILEPYIEAYWLTGSKLLELKDAVHKGGVNVVWLCVAMNGPLAIKHLTVKKNFQGRNFLLILCTILR